MSADRLAAIIVAVLVIGMIAAYCVGHLVKERRVGRTAKGGEMALRDQIEMALFACGCLALGLSIGWLVTNEHKIAGIVLCFASVLYVVFGVSYTLRDRSESEKDDRGAEKERHMKREFCSHCGQEFTPESLAYMRQRVRLQTRYELIATLTAIVVIGGAILLKHFL